MQRLDERLRLLWRYLWWNIRQWSTTSSLSLLRSRDRVADRIGIIVRPATDCRPLTFPSVAFFLFALLLMLTQHHNSILIPQLGHGSAAMGGRYRGFCYDRNP